MVNTKTVISIIGAVALSIAVVCSVLAIGGSHIVEGDSLPKIGAVEIERQLENTLTNQGWDLDKTRKEQILPIEFRNDDGDVITYYVYHFINMEYGNSPPAIHEIFDPNTADSQIECKVNEYNAVLYRKQEYSYLWWSPDTETILLIEYEPYVVSDAEIMALAESVVKS